MRDLIAISGYKTTILAAFLGASLFNGPTAAAYVGPRTMLIEQDYDYQRFADRLRNARNRSESEDALLAEFHQRASRQAQVVADMQSRITTLPGEISDLKTKKQTLEQKLQNLQTEQAALKTALAKAQGQLLSTQSEIPAKKTAIENAKNKLNLTKKQCQEKNTGDCPALIGAAQTELVNAEGALRALTASEQQLKTIIGQMSTKIQVDTTQITQSQNQIKNIEQKIPNLETQLSNMNKQVDAERSSLKNLASQEQQQSDRAQRERQEAHHAHKELERYARDLENSIEQVNYQGAQKGLTDGNRDGIETARLMGQDDGSRDGSNDGKADGQSAGQNRDYDSGQKLGLESGQKQGLAKGTKEGQDSGWNQAHIDLGKTEGTAFGVDLAEKSDAAKIGETQGLASGINRATDTGKRRGDQQAENESVKKYMTDDLPKVIVNGPYSGIFSRILPSLPNSFKGGRFSPNPPNGKSILQQSYIDGYLFNYDQEVGNSFANTVVDIYNSTYDSSYNSGYGSSYAQTYKDYYDRGYNDGYNSVFEDSRKSAFNQQYPIAYQQALKNPNRETSAFKTSFSKAKDKAYGDRYEQIRAKIFAQVDEKTFNANIDNKTLEAKTLRLGQLESLIQNYPILSFIESSVKDVGFAGVTLPDGMFQPGEGMNHSVVIKNYGFKPMTGATVGVSTGTGPLVLPDIPARSEVTIKGAILGKVKTDAKPKTIMSSFIKINAPLTSGDSFQGKYYDDATKNTLILGNETKTKVLYPIYVSGIQNNFEKLKVNQVQNFKLSLLNTSEIIYKNVEVVLKSDSTHDIFIRKFETIPEVNSGLDIADAKIMPELIDAGKKITIQGYLQYKGVVLGIFDRPIQFSVFK